MKKIDLKPCKCGSVNFYSNYTGIDKFVIEGSNLSHTGSESFEPEGIFYCSDCHEAVDMPDDVTIE
ncbi:MAG: hypothetical protein FWG20_05425 [Candidatus Cloacimonetes bacterium]|nr:hypothetical protein [Candidatus Cloacimonadota bacterium]